MRRCTTVLLLFIPAIIFGDIAYIDSISRTISIDSLMDIMEKLTGEEPYPSGYTSWSRFTFHEGCDSATVYLRNRMMTCGLDSVFFQFYTDTMEGYYDSLYGGGHVIFTSQNVVALKKGNIYSDTCIVIGAHYDSVSEPYTDFDTKAPGADDNASGTGAIIEICRIMETLETDYDVYLVCFSGEEIGGTGSQKFLDEFINVNGLTVKLMMCMDMIGYSQGELITDIYTIFQEVADLGEILCPIMTNNRNLLISQYGALSDDYPFSGAGIRSCAIIEHNWFSYPGYHQQIDPLIYEDSSYYWDNTRFSFGMMYFTANSPETVNNFAGKDNGDSTLTLTWDASPEPDIDHYMINFRKASGGDYAYYGPINGDLTSCKMRILPFDTTTYLLTISAVDTGEYFSFRSNAIYLRATYIPVPPESVYARSDSQYIYLEIANVACSDFDHYNVYRKINNGSYAVTGTTSDTLYTDSMLNDTGAYYYTVTAVDTTGLESKYSMEVSARKITCDQYMLVIDETKNGTLMTDAHCDAFYDSLFTDMLCDIVDADTIKTVNTALFGNYSKTVVIDDDLTESKLDYTSVEDYISSGGRMLLVGWNIGNKITGVTGENPVYPDTGDISYRVFNIDEYKYRTDYDMSYMSYDINGPDTMRFSSDKLPRGSGGNASYAGVFQLNNGLEWGYYGSASSDTSYQDKVVTFSHEDSTLITVNAPLFSMEYNDGRRFMEDILSLWDVNTGMGGRIPVNERHLISMNGLQLNNLSMRLEGFADEYVDISVYDINGRVIYNTTMNVVDNKYELSIDKALRTGVYFIKVKSPNMSETSKVILLK